MLFAAKMTAAFVLVSAMFFSAMGYVGTREPAVVDLLMPTGLGLLFPYLAVAAVLFSLRKRLSLAVPKTKLIVLVGAAVAPVLGFLLALPVVCAIAKECL